MQPGQLTAADRRNIPYNIKACSATKVGGKKEEGGHLELRCLSSKVTVMHDTVLLSWRWLNTCLLMGSSERINCLALLSCAAFALLIKLSVSQSMSFLTFTLSILSPILPMGVSKLCGG